MIMIVLDPHPEQDSPGKIVHQFIHGLRPPIEGGNRRKNDGACAGCLSHQPQMSEMQGGLAYSQDQLASFLQTDICRTDDQVIGIGIGDPRKGLDRTGHDQHALGHERPRGDARPDVLRIIAGGRQRFHVCDCPVRFAGDGLPGRAADDQMRFDPGFLQQFEGADAQNGAAGPGDRQNDLVS